VKQLKIRKLIFVTISCLIFAFYFFSPELCSFNKIDLEQEYFHLSTLADKFRKDGKFEESIRLFEKSLSTAKKTTNKKRECESLIKLGLLYWNIGLLKDSAVHYENALQLAQKFNFKYLQEKSQNAL
jgi:tetratricopeptide (TPR) repeat protein